MRLEREEEAFGGINSQDTATGNPFLVPCANESLEEDLTPTFPSDSFIDSSTMGFSSSVPGDASPEQLTHELESSAERSYPELVTQEEHVDLQAGHVISGEENERSVSAASNKNGTGKSSRLLRNEVSPPVAADEIAEETREDQHLLSEPAQNSSGNLDNNDDYCRGEEAPNSNRTPQNSKKPVSGNEKTGRRRKKADVPDSSDKELPKKKFSHSTRRNRRKVDKILLETPDHEIDPRKLTLKDLILLAEAKERLLSKDPNAAKNPLPNQRNTRDTSFGEEDSFGLPEDSFGLRDDSFGLRDDSSFGYQDDEQAAPSAQPKLNYHTFMKRTSKQSWSQQDTELFYEGIRQFGTDFAMIQQLFPGRTRHQVKLKYKKEEKQHPQRLSDALTNRSKNHSRFELVIERLKKLQLKLRLSKILTEMTNLLA
ncbi:transcription factor TFIIIB component B'' homolog [Papaver somniferum]|uniref:transcription factor TFIIIB component B'' homolog n=1 Tax=Papaver somniferum TaxID=3469 RepID=UPI000E6F9671|nr:transcription factor TFIIIB component B'' homolog [Papaver somniferum]